MNFDTAEATSAPPAGATLSDSTTEPHVSSDSDDDFKPKTKYKLKKEPKAKKTPEKKSYRCDRCNFSSSSKAKYTKHAKSAHSGTIVQCDHCEFKTPYKWNLDRHYKNHLGGGALCCHLCNFSCDIKQSLTVHLQNHHTNVPEEIIESVKRTPIPSRNQSNKNNNDRNNSANNPTNTDSSPSSPKNNAISTTENTNDSEAAATAVGVVAAENLQLPGEKKVPPLRISRSLTGLALGEENNSNDEGGKAAEEDESAAAAVSAAPATATTTASAGSLSGSNDVVAATTSSSSSGEHEIRTVRKCEHCDFETSGVGNASSEMKRHLASQHGIHHHKKHHHRHHHNRMAAAAVRESSSSPEYCKTQNPSLPVVPIPLPPKKSKGATSPRPGQSASSTSNSPAAIHRSQSPLKASEAICSYTAAGQSESSSSNQAIAPSEEDHPQSILNLTQNHHHQLKSSGEESAFTPIQGGGEFSQQQLASLKKPRHRALAQFYQKIKPIVVEDTTATASEAPSTPEKESSTSSSSIVEPAVAVPDDLTEDRNKNGSVVAENESNRCLFCSTRCKTSVELAVHMENCGGQKSGANQDHEEEEEEDEEEDESKLKGLALERKHEVSETSNTSGGDLNDGLIGFEMAPGVGAIHSDKLDEMEYEGHGSNKDHNDLEGSIEKAALDNEEEEEDDVDDETSEDNKKAGKGKAQTTNRKVYRCPENDCSFWATTASRFHVHIVGHFNLKPFECSECHYKSNWRWDVNKHIRLKTPKDPKHAVAKTLLTHESGQRDYRKYDNYLVTMSLQHSPNTKAPDCSTSAKRTKGSTVSTPKSSPDIPKDSSNGVSSPSSSPKKKLTKVPASSSSSTGSIPPTSSEENGIFKVDSLALPPDSTPTSNAATSSDGSGRIFVEARMHAGGEIYQTSLLKPDMAFSASEGIKPEPDDKAPNGFDLTLKPTHKSRHTPHQKRQKEEEAKLQNSLLSHDKIDMQTQNSSLLPLIPSKKSRLHQHQHEGNQTTGSAINEQGNKVFSMWQCIKCSFKHINKDLVSTHIREQHKPKKGDPLSLLTNNHLVQVMIPEQDADALMASSTTTSDELDYSISGRALTPGQKKETYQKMYDEIGKVISCRFCPFTTGLMYEMEIHAEHHLTASKNYYSCPHCSYSVAVKSELQEHLKLHGINIPLEHLEVQISSSSMISSTTDRVPAMLSPTSTTENLCKRDLNRLVCPLCPFVAFDSNEYQYHKECHEPSDHPFKCHQCSFSVNEKQPLLQHLRLHGIQIDEVSPPDEPPKSLLDCEYETISDPGTQEEPLNLSTFADRKPGVFWDANGIRLEGYQCSVCPEIFPDLYDLKVHEFSSNHRQERNFTSNEAISNRQCDSPPCEVLNLSVKPDHPNESSQSSYKVNNGTNKSIMSSLNLPPLNPTSSVPLSSPSSSSSLNSVDASSTSSTKCEKEFLYLCDECPARFFFEKELKIHHTFHENKSPYQCPKCSYSARQKDPHLMSHMRVHTSAYKEKTKSLLSKYPRGRVNLTSSSNAISATPATTTPAAAVAAAAALSAASLLSFNQGGLLHPGFNLQTAAAALSKLKNDPTGTFPADLSGLDTFRKNGLSIVCPKCPEKFYTPQAFQQHIELHSNGRAPSSEFRCRFCDYCAESRKSLTVHELVHTGSSEISIEPAAAAAAAAKFLSVATAPAFNPVSMMALVSNQDSAFANAASAVNLAGGDSAILQPPAAAPSPDNSSDKSSAPVPEEAYEGNPDFVYPTYTKNGRVKSKRYKCTKCPSAFEKKDQYHTHIGLHGSNQKYKCTVCDYAVTYYANFIQHLKKHENQRNIPGDALNLGRKRSSDEDGNGPFLKASKMSDNGGDSRSSSVSSNVSSIDSHDTQIQGINGIIGNLTKCPYCPYQAFDQATLQAHLLHHQDNPNWLHLCDLCNFRTSSKKSLKEHGKLHAFSNFHHQQQQQQDVQGVNHNLKNDGIMNGSVNAKGEYLNGYQNSRSERRKGEEEYEESSNASV